jgi:multiple sugar transport system substrate-binding protein
VPNLSRRGALRLTAGMALSCALPLAGCGRNDDSAATGSAEHVDDSPAKGTVTVWAA